MNRPPQKERVIKTKHVGFTEDPYDGMNRPQAVPVIQRDRSEAEVEAGWFGKVPMESKSPKEGGTKHKPGQGKYAW